MYQLNRALLIFKISLIVTIYLMCKRNKFCKKILNYFEATRKVMSTGYYYLHYSNIKKPQTRRQNSRFSYNNYQISTWRFSAVFTHV